MTENNNCSNEINKLQNNNFDYLKKLSIINDKDDNNINEQNREIDKELKKLDYSNLIKMKKSFAKKIFFFICIWSIFIISVIFFQGFNKFTNFKLNNAVLITLISSSFIQIVGLMYIVLKHIFSSYIRIESKNK